MKTLLPHQEIGAKFLRRKRFGLLYDEQGVGKTLQALAASEPPLLVICPAYLMGQWVDEIRDQFGIEAAIVSKEKGAASQFTVCSYERVKHFHGPIETLIVDEASYIKNQKSQRSKAVLKLAESAKRIYALTGTPIINRPIDLWPILQLLRRRRPGGFFRWAIKYCAGYQHEFGWDFSGASHLDELRNDLNQFGLRRTKSEVLPDLPPKRYTTHRVKTVADVKKAGDILAAFIEAGGDLTSAAGIGHTQRLRVASALSKVEVVNAWLDDYLLGNSSKVVVFCGFKDPLRKLVQARSDCVLVDGDIPESDRGKLLDRFRDDPDTRVCAITFGVGQYGRNLQHSDTVVFLDLPWTPAEVEQAEDRVHRFGQKSAVMIVRFISDHPVEEMILTTLDDKMSVIDAVSKGVRQRLVLRGLASTTATG